MFASPKYMLLLMLPHYGQPKNDHILKSPIESAPHATQWECSEKSSTTCSPMKTEGPAHMQPSRKLKYGMYRGQLGWPKHAENARRTHKHAVDVNKIYNGNPEPHAISTPPGSQINTRGCNSQLLKLLSSKWRHLRAKTSPDIVFWVYTIHSW